jgi:GntR family transcriptional repressor for pyruvate dehydrogenase complex
MARAAASGSGRKSLADLVFDRMQRAIKSGSYRPDERLPTEHELAAEFEVSRPVVREALKRLRDQGLIYSRQGAGSFVRQLGLRQPLGFGQLENVSDLLSCYEFRLTVEPEAAALAAERHRPETLAGISAALDLLRDATNRLSHREDADFQFHLSIANASENTYFSTAMEALKDHIAVGMRFHGASVKREASGLTRVFGEHAAIFEAIRERQPDIARERMKNHLIGSRERLFERRRPDGTVIDEVAMPVEA